MIPNTNVAYFSEILDLVSEATAVMVNNTVRKDMMGEIIAEIDVTMPDTLQGVCDARSTGATTSDEEQQCEVRDKTTNF